MALHRAIVGVLLLALAPSTLAAQITFGASVFGGAVVPTGDLVDQTTVDGLRRFGHKTGFVGGGRFALYVTPRFAVEAEGAYALSDLDVLNATISPPVDTTLDANLIVGSVNAVYTILDPPLDPLAVYVSGGVGVVYRDIEPLESTTDPAGVLGIGFRYGVSPKVDIRVDVRDYISSYKEDVEGAESKLQNDLLLTAGVEFKFGGY